MTDNDATAFCIPGFFLPHIETFVASSGGDVDKLYAKAGIDRAAFMPLAHTVTEDQFYTIATTAAKLSNEPAIGLEIGQRFSLGSLGLVSQALMSCATLRDVAQMLERYSELINPLMRFSSYETESDFVLDITILSSYPDLNQMIFEAVISWSTSMLPLLLGREVTVDKISCQFEAPIYANKFLSSTARKFEFSAPKNLICIKRSYADLQLTTANPIDAASTTEECEKELTRSLQTKSLTDLVVEHLHNCMGKNPSSKEIAQQLNMTERTFRRRLAGEGTNYRSLVNDIRQELAKYYLRETHLQIAQIAFKLGYSDTSNFRNSFKSWTGMSPRAWRERELDCT